MADEWVSVRARLTKDPKTIRVANWLLSHAPFREIFRVTIDALPRSVILRYVAFAMVDVWAVANARGIPDGDDCILTHCDFDAIDEIGETPGLALAMESVRWLHQEQHDGVSAVRLPNFGEYNTPAELRSDAEQRKREQNRDRQRRFRERRNASNADVTRCNGHNRTAQHRTESAANAQCKDRGMQGGKDFSSAPRAFLSTLDEYLSVLPVGSDQMAFLARLAYADASGFEFSKPIMDYIGRAKGSRGKAVANPAGWLTDAIRSDLGPDRWREFEDSTPSLGQCVALVAKAGRDLQ